MEQYLQHIRPTGEKFMPSDKVSANRTDAAVVAYAWRNMTPAEKFGFARLGPYIPDWDGKRNAHPLSGYQTFQAISRARYAALLELDTTAPATPDLPPSLGKVTLTATSGPTGQTLRLVPAALYPFPCQIWAAAPQMEWTAAMPLSTYRVLCSVPQMPAEGVDLRTAFNTCFYGFTAGHKLFVRVCPISPSGFRGQPVVVDTVVGQG